MLTIECLARISHASSGDQQQLKGIRGEIAEHRRRRLAVGGPRTRAIPPDHDPQLSKIEAGLAGYAQTLGNDSIATFQASRRVGASNVCPLCGRRSGAHGEDDSPGRARLSTRGMGRGRLETAQRSRTSSPRCPDRGLLAVGGVLVRGGGLPQF